MLAADALALPMSSELTPDDASRVVMALDRVVVELAGGAPWLSVANPFPPDGHQSKLTLS